MPVFGYYHALHGHAIFGEGGLGPGRMDHCM